MSKDSKPKRKNRKRQPKNKKRTDEADVGEGSSAQAGDGSRSNEKTEGGNTPTESSHVTDTPSRSADSDKAYIDAAVEQIRADLKKLKGVGKKTDRANEPKPSL